MIENTKTIEPFDDSTEAESCFIIQKHFGIVNKTGKSTVPRENLRTFPTCRSYFVLLYTEQPHTTPSAASSQSPPIFIYLSIKPHPLIPRFVHPPPPVLPVLKRMVSKQERANCM